MQRDGKVFDGGRVADQAAAREEIRLHLDRKSGQVAQSLALQKTKPAKRNVWAQYKADERHRFVAEKREI